MKFGLAILSTVGAIILTILSAVVFSNGDLPNNELEELRNALVSFNYEILLKDYGLKTAILALVLYLTISSIWKAWQGKDLAEKVRDAIKSNSIFGLNEIRCVGFDSGDNKKSSVKMASKLCEDLEKVVKDGKVPEEGQILPRLLLNVCRSFDLGQSYHAATSALENERAALEKRFADYFVDTGFAKTSLPLIGFAGTIVGIMVAMKGLGELVGAGEDAIGAVVRSLSVAFDTTLVALVCTYIVKSYEKTYARAASAAIGEIARKVELDLLGKLRVPVLTKRLEDLVAVIAHKGRMAYHEAELAALRRRGVADTGPEE